MTEPLLVTIETIPGVEYSVMGMIHAAVPYWGTTYNEGIKSVKDGATHPDVPSILERRRSEVLDRLVAKAQVLGASAVVGVRVDHREISNTWKELYAYGTAVTIHGPSRGNVRSGVGVEGDETGSPHWHLPPT